MKAKEYSEVVLRQLCAAENVGQTNYNGAFLGAALAIMQEVESPMREEALVKLAMIISNQQKLDSKISKNAA